jgi:hypothetical protein
VFQALLTLLRSCTGESWNFIMHELAGHSEGCTVDPQWDPLVCGFHGSTEACIPIAGCGAGGITYFYFITFTLIVTFVFINLFVTVILEAFMECSHSTAEQLERADKVAADMLEAEKAARRGSMFTDLMESPTKVVSFDTSKQGPKKPAPVTFSDFHFKAFLVKWSEVDPRRKKVVTKKQLHFLMVTCMPPMGLGVMRFVTWPNFERNWDDKDSGLEENIDGQLEEYNLVPTTVAHVEKLFTEYGEEADVQQEYFLYEDVVQAIAVHYMVSRMRWDLRHFEAVDELATRDRHSRAAVGGSVAWEKKRRQKQFKRTKTAERMQLKVTKQMSTHLQRAQRLARAASQPDLVGRGGLFRRTASQPEMGTPFAGNPNPTLTLVLTEPPLDQIPLGSPARATFTHELLRDLSKASVVPARRFNILSIRAGSVIVLIEVRPASHDAQLSATVVCETLLGQLADETRSTQVFNGMITKHVDCGRTVEMNKPEEKKDSGSDGESHDSHHDSPFASLGLRPRHAPSADNSRRNAIIVAPTDTHSGMYVLELKANHRSGIRQPLGLILGALNRDPLTKAALASGNVSSNTRAPVGQAVDKSKPPPSEAPIVVVLRLTRNLNGTPRLAEMNGVRVGDRLVSVNRRFVTPQLAVQMLMQAKYPQVLAFQQARNSYWKKLKTRQFVMSCFKVLGGTEDDLTSKAASMVKMEERASKAVSMKAGGQAAMMAAQQRRKRAAAAAASVDMVPEEDGVPDRTDAAAPVLIASGKVTKPRSEGGVSVPEVDDVVDHHVEDDDDDDDDDDDEEEEEETIVKKAKSRIQELNELHAPEPYQVVIPNTRKWRRRRLGMILGEPADERFRGMVVVVSLASEHDSEEDRVERGSATGASPLTERSERDAAHRHKSRHSGTQGAIHGVAHGEEEEDGDDDEEGVQFRF